MVLLVLSGAVAGFTGGGGGEGAGILGLVAFLFIVGGGITGALGYFGLGSMYGGTNTLAGVFSIIFAVVPIALIVLGTSGGMGGMGALKIILILVFGVPGLLGLLGGMGVMKASNSMAKPAGLVSLIGGIALLAMTVLLLVGSPQMMVDMASIFQILTYVGFFGTAVGFFLTGAAMLGEKNA
ncbi:MAG TPA: hypothetical protein PK095_05205 [Myxococcota bacterium]|nr:hypothetical protein [Myxococcota bacterium]